MKHERSAQDAWRSHVRSAVRARSGRLEARAGDCLREGPADRRRGAVRRTARVRRRLREDLSRCARTSTPRWTTSPRADELTAHSSSGWWRRKEDPAVRPHRRRDDRGARHAAGRPSQQISTASTWSPTWCASVSLREEGGRRRRRRGPRPTGARAGTAGTTSPRAQWDLIAGGTVFIDVAGAKIGEVNEASRSTRPASTSSARRRSRRPSRWAMRASSTSSARRIFRVARTTRACRILAGYLRASTRRSDRSRSPRQSVRAILIPAWTGTPASSTELYAVLSALADPPLRLDLASQAPVSQRGADPAGFGARERKVEGSSTSAGSKHSPARKACSSRKANISDLMLEPRRAGGARRALHASTRSGDDR